MRWHRVLPSQPAAAILTRQNGKWSMVFPVKVEAAAAPTSTATIGIDLGLTALAALANGETIERPRLTQQAGQGLRRRQRALARCKPGSKRRARRKAEFTSRKYWALSDALAPEEVPGKDVSLARARFACATIGAQ